MNSQSNTFVTTFSSSALGRATETQPARIPDSVLTPHEENLLYRKIIFRIVPLFFLGFVLSYLDRVNIGFAKLQMQVDFGLSDRTFAIGASLFFWGYMLLEIPSNLILQRVGARAWIGRIMITWGLVSMLMIFSRNQTAFYALRILLGICEAGFVPGVLYYTSTWLPSNRQSRMYSLFLMAMPVSLLIGSPLSGAILETMQGTGGLRAWQWLFLLEGFPCILVGLAIVFFLKNTPREATWLSEVEKDIVESNLAKDSSHKVHRVKDALLSGNLYALIAVMILFNTAFYGLLFWLPTLLHDRGISNNFHVGLYNAIPFGVAAVVMVLNERLAAQSGKQRLHGTVAVLIASVSLFLATYQHQRFWVALIFLTLTASGVLSLMPLYWTLPGRLLSGSAAAAGLALINSFGSLSGVLGSVIIGFTGMQVGMYILAGMLMACGVLFTSSTRSHCCYSDASRVDQQAEISVGG
jgi:MFS family permease